MPDVLRGDAPTKRSDAEASSAVAHRPASYRRSMLWPISLLCKMRNALARIGSDVQAAAAVWNISVENEHAFA